MESESSLHTKKNHHHHQRYHHLANMHLGRLLIGNSGDWLSRRPRITQGCGFERMDGFIFTENAPTIDGKL
jgi:hypothetical protein